MDREEKEDKDERLRAQGKYGVETFARDVVFMHPGRVRHYLAKGPAHYPQHWKDLGVHAYKPGRRLWVIVVSCEYGRIMRVETQEVTLPDHPVTVYHSLGAEPQNVVVTVTDKGILGPAPAVGEVTASSYALKPLSGVASGQVVRHTPIRPAVIS